MDAVKTLGYEVRDAFNSNGSYYELWRKDKLIKVCTDWNDVYKWMILDMADQQGASE